MLHHSTKYDGSLHYRFNTAVVSRATDMIATYRGPGTEMESYRGLLPGKLHVLTVHWCDRPWNLSVGWYADWVGREHYVNIATPADWSTGVLRWVDLDLDLIWRADAQTVHLDDEDEFALHRERFGYPPELIARCETAAQQVKAMMDSRRGLFDGRLYDWRPGKPLPSLQ